VSGRRQDPGRLQRWYPSAWRERYGDELGALIEDQLEGRSPTMRFRLQLAVAGLRERAHEACDVGPSASPAERARSGILLVLGGWAAFVVAGTSFAKLAEHYPDALSRPDRMLPTGAFDVVVVAATIAGAFVVLGAGVLLPAFARFIRAGGWPRIRRQVRQAVAVTVIAISLGVGMVGWAGSLSPAQRNGADAAYVAAFVCLALLASGAVALWARAAGAALRRLEFGRSALLVESGLAVVVALSMCAMTVATAIWWGAMATDAPWFLHGARAGSVGSPLDLRLAGTAVLMLGAALVGGFGILRLATSWTATFRDPPAAP
jgi:hypothetical protein